MFFSFFLLLVLYNEDTTVGQGLLKVAEEIGSCQRGWKIMDTPVLFQTVYSI
jgi:hypothetical protein